MLWLPNYGCRLSSNRRCPSFINDHVLVSHTPDIFDFCDEISKFYPFIVDGCVLSEPLFGPFTNKQNIHHWAVLQMASVDCFLNSTYQNYFINDATPEGLMYYNNNFCLFSRKSSQDTNNLIMDLFVCIQPAHAIHTQRELPKRRISVPHRHTQGQVALAGNVYFVILF